MRVGFIGSGRIGSTLAELAVASGYDVVLSNSRGPQTLSELVATLDGRGVQVGAATVEDAAAAAELAVVTIPLKAYRDVPPEPLAGKVVIDTCNYYPDRDGPMPELEGTTSSELVAAHLGQSQVVKAFNTIYFEDLRTQGQPAGTVGRRALPIAGDDDAAKMAVANLIVAFGFDVVDAGALREGRRFEPGTPAYNVRLTEAELREALAAA